MRILLVSIDTHGGVAPYGALAAGLARAGHEVAVAAPEDLANQMVPDTVRPIALPGSSRGAVELLGSTEKVRRAPRQLRGLLRDRTAAAVHAIQGSGFAAELVLAGVGGSVVGQAVAVADDARFLAAHLQPVGPATTRYPAVLAPAGFRAPGPPRLAGHLLSPLLVGLPTAGTRSAAHAAAGIARKARPRRVPGAVYGYSEHVVPRPPSWKPDRVITGYWTPPLPRAALAPALEVFLRAGPPPIVAGFGSMRTSDPAAVTTALVEAAARLDHRLVLLTGWNRPDHKPLPGHVFRTEQAPHQLLYPRAAIAVHHGGAGTTGASLTAGIPTVVVSFAADQPFWGGRVHALGAGPAPLPVRSVTTDSLTAALQAAARDPTRRAAQDLGRRLTHETGVDTAVAAVHHLTEHTLGR